jgi:hypothetical protein
MQTYICLIHKDSIQITLEIILILKNVDIIKTKIKILDIGNFMVPSL